MRLHRLRVALLSALALAACDKNTLHDPSGPAPTSGIMFLNFGVNSPTVQFYDGERKLTASSSSTCQLAKNPPVTATDTLCLTVGGQATSGLAYGSIAASSTGGSEYVGVDPGTYTITAHIATTASADYGLTISTVPVTVEAGKWYSLYQSGFYNTTTKTVDAFYVEDPIPATVDWTKSYVRLVNAIGNSQPMTLYGTLTGGTGEVAIGGPVAYKAAGAFTEVAPGLYDLRTRYTGETTNRVVRTGVPLVGGHVYTISARGDLTVTSTTATNRPILEVTANR